MCLEWDTLKVLTPFYFTASCLCAFVCALGCFLFNARVIQIDVFIHRVVFSNLSMFSRTRDGGVITEHNLI